jgi:hypothetical protein
VAHLQRLGATLCFADHKSPSKVTRAYLFTSAPHPEETAPFLQSLTGLEELSLGKNAFTDADVAPLAGLTELRDLSLSNTRVTDAGLPHLKQLAKLERLYLSFLPITDAGLSHLIGHSTLKELSLLGTKVTPEGADRLRSTLVDLHISGIYAPNRVLKLFFKGGKVERRGEIWSNEPIAFIVSMTAGKTYDLSLDSNDFDPALIVQDQDMHLIDRKLFDGVRGATGKVSLSLTPKADGDFRVLVGVLGGGAGRFVLTIAEK